MTLGFNNTLTTAREDIFAFCKMLRFQPTDQQADLLKRVQFHTFAPMSRRKKGIACKSGQGPGKTAVTTVAMQWRVLQGVDERGVVSAPTMRQVRDVWMTEISKTVARAVPEYQRLVRVDSTKVTFCGRKKWGIFTATSSRPENLQGYHSPMLTVLLDEASGIGRPIWETVKGTTTGADNLILAIGNPNDRDTEFFDMFNKDIDLYDTMTWSAEDSPNVSKRHIADMEEEYGRESDIFRVRVLGEFPRQNPNAVIRYEDLMHCCTKTQFATAMRAMTPLEGRDVRQIGIDFARYGSDESVVIARYNSAVVGRPLIYVKREPADVLREAMSLQHQLGWTNDQVVYCCDANGMGQGAMHVLYEAGRQVYEFHSQAAPVDNTRFNDAITEGYFNLRRLTSSRTMSLKHDSRLFGQLTQRVYRYKQDLFWLEDKDAFMARAGSQEFSSPDRADALVLAFYPYASGTFQYFRGER
jgi:hypothetical protein